MNENADKSLGQFPAESDTQRALPEWAWDSLKMGKIFEIIVNGRRRSLVGSVTKIENGDSRETTRLLFKPLQGRSLFVLVKDILTAKPFSPGKQLRVIK